MKIQVLGTGCEKCKKLAENVQVAAHENGVDAEIEKITAINDIMKFGVMTTPALAIEGKVVSAGKLLSPTEIAKFLTAPNANNGGGADAPSAPSSSENNLCGCSASNSASNTSCCRSSTDHDGCCVRGKGGKIFLIVLIVLAIILYFATSRKAESNERVANATAPTTPHETQSETQYEVLYFHASWRCVNCNNAETWAKKAVDELRAAGVANNNINFRSVQLDTNAALAQQLNAKRVDAFIVKKTADKIIAFALIANLLPLVREGEASIQKNIKVGVNNFITANK